MTDNSAIIDLLTTIVETIESQDTQAQNAKNELLEQLKVIASKTDTVSTNFPKLIETLSNFDSKIASSFDDIQSVSKQLDSVVQQVSIAEQAILNVQQQSQKLNLNSTLRSINEADEQAQQLNKHLKSSSSQYVENMNSATDIAIEQINKLKNEVSTIADSFSKIVSSKIADNVIDTVSARFTDKLTQDFDNKISHASSNAADKLTSQTFEKIQPAITAFSEKIAKSNEQDFQRFNATRAAVIEASEASHKLYLEREHAYQAHVSKEKSVVKRNWLLIIIGGWIAFSITVLGVSYAVKSASEATVDDALKYLTLKNELNKNGFSVEDKEFCQSILPKQQFNFSQGPQVSTCFYLRSPSKEYEVNGRNLMIFTK